MDGGVTPRALGRALREQRTAIGLSAREVGARVAMDGSYVDGIERGERNPTIRNLNRLCAALEVPLSAVVLRAEAIDAEPREQSPQGAGLRQL